MKSLYFLELQNKKLFKGETNKEFNEFGFGIICNNKDSPKSFQINGTLEMAFEAFNYNFYIDYENNKSLLASKDNGNKLYWVVDYSTFTKTKNLLEKIQNSQFDFFNKIDFAMFYAMKRPVKYLVSKLLYNKIFLLDDIFVNIENKCVNMDETLNLGFQKLKRQFNEIINSFPLAVDNDTTLLNIDEEIKRLLEGYIEGNKKEILKVVKEIQNTLVEAFGKTDLISKEYFAFNIKNEKYKLISNKDEFHITKDDQTLKFNLLDNSLEYSNGPFTLIKSKTLVFNTGSILYYFDNDNKSIYNGEYITSKNGFGVELITDNINKGFYYIGGFREGFYNDIGIFSNSVYIYSGDFENSSKKGKCILQAKKDGSIYQGDIDNNVIQGRGKYVYRNSNIYKIYEGQFRDNMLEGEGKVIFENNDEFIGNFARGLKDGEGAYKNGENMARLKYKLDEELIEESKYKY
jgi:hypothetical protein